MKYYKNKNNELFVDPIVANHEGLVELTKAKFDAQLEINNTPTEEQLAEQVQSEMITELNWCDLQLKYHATGDTKRAISTAERINAYAVECRDYVQNVDGVLTIVGDKPSRPE